MFDFYKDNLKEIGFYMSFIYGNYVLILNIFYVLLLVFIYKFFIVMGKIWIINKGIGWCYEEIDKKIDSYIILINC